MKKTAIVMCARCEKDRQLFGIRVEKRQQDWHFTWTFPLKEEMAEREGFTKNNIKGENTIIDEEYHGCPYCGAKSLVHCSTCGQLTCIDSDGDYNICAYCGTAGYVNNGWDGLELSGGGY